MEAAANQALISALETSLGSRPSGSGIWPCSLFLLSLSDWQLTAKTCLRVEMS